MDKKFFIKTLKQFKQVEDDVQGVHDAMKKLSPDFGGFYIDGYSEIILNLLEELINDESGWIGYFIYDLEWGKKYHTGCVKSKEGKNLRLKTVSDLYNIIIKKI